MRDYLLSVGVIFAVVVFGIVVDRIYQRFSTRHPELGPFRKNDGSCGCCAAKSACQQKSSCS